MKVDGPCVLIARLLTGRDVFAINELLLSLRPWSRTGSEWDVRELFGREKSYADHLRIGRRGDYDFTETGLTSLLYLMANSPDRLYPETARHIAEKLLTSKGGRFQWSVPGSFAMVSETENHLLMTESSRYLGNQWLRKHGNSAPDFDNRANGLEATLIRFLKLILQGGFDEYNSNPYQGFSFHALLNLEAFAESAPVAGLARRILDRETGNYALGSLRLRRVAPFRRRLDHACREIFDEPLSLMMAVWSREIEVPKEVQARALESSFALLASVLPYRPTNQTLSLLKPEKASGYFLRIGRGRNGSPEVYSSGPGFLLSAGGLAFAPLALTQTVVRPTTLLLDDGENDLASCIRLANKGNASTRWNNTGVAPRFACGDAPVLVPERFIPTVQAGCWSVIQPSDQHDLMIVIYSKEDLGIIAVFPGWTHSSGELLDSVISANPEPAVNKHFIFPDSHRVIEFDVNAPKTKWVIVSDHGVGTERDFSVWPSRMMRRE